MLEFTFVLFIYLGYNLHTSHSLFSLDFLVPEQTLRLNVMILVNTSLLIFNSCYALLGNCHILMLYHVYLDFEPNNNCLGKQSPTLSDKSKFRVTFRKTSIKEYCTQNN